MNEIRDDDRIIQIAAERGYSCGDRRHAILLTAHSTFTQQTQYTDNMTTLNERQFFLLCMVLPWRPESCQLALDNHLFVIESLYLSLLCPYAALL